MLIGVNNSSLGGLSFYEDESGNKYVVGADSVPKKLGSGELTYIGTASSSIDVTSVISDYKNKTVDDFIVEPYSFSEYFYANLGDMNVWVNNNQDASGSGGANFSKSYNADTGVLTVSPSSVTARASKSYGICNISYKIYCK